MKIQLPFTVKMIIEKLESKGYDAYAVGGCVRDTVMGKCPSDWDICTSALPCETLDVLKKDNIIKNGIKHGTVTVRFDGQNYEITTFRTDGSYLDNRRPSNVTFVSSLREDLSRRDFTINAMAYNDRDGLTDYFSGAADIEKKLVRCVGEPDKRFNEDALRILRALRFSSVLGFDIDKKTSEAIHKNAELLKNISFERIMSEFVKILMGKNVESVLLGYSDVISVFIPEIIPMIGFEQKNPHHVYDVWTHTVKTVAAVKNEKTLRLAALLHDFGKPQKFTVDENGVGHFKGHPKVSAEMAKNILTRLKADNKTKNDTVKLIELHDVRISPEPKYVRRLAAKIGEELYPSLIELKRADSLAQNPDMRSQKLEYADKLQRIFNEEVSRGAVFSMKSLALNGNDIINFGITDGVEIGRCLKYLYMLVINGEAENTKQALTEKLRDIKKD